MPQIDFHYLIIDKDGRPRQRELVSKLIDHIVYYSLPEQEFASIRFSHDLTKFARVFREALKLFRKNNKSGDAGELLYYFLMEAVLGAPQILSKMSLKTADNVEVNGADGVHMRWNEQEQRVDVFLGESKIYENVTAAIKSAVNSLQHIEKDQGQRELLLATRHFKWARPEIRETALKYIDPDSPARAYRINYTIMIGFSAPADLQKSVIELQHFLDWYQKKQSELCVTVFENVDGSSISGRVVRVFFVPLFDAKSFRAEFLREMTMTRTD